MAVTARKQAMFWGIGFLLLALTLFVIIAYKAQTAMNAASQNAARATNEVVLEEQARRVLRQIGHAVMGSNRDSLIPVSIEPYPSEGLKYQVNLGIQDGEVVWSDPEKVGLELDALQVYWSRNPDTEEESRVVWTNLVTPFLEGELPNGIDDNGNGLIDEQGLNFVIDRDAVTIRLTLERRTDSGETVSKTVQTTITCRNLEPTP